MAKKSKSNSAQPKPFNILTDGSKLVASVRETLARAEADVLVAGDPNKPKIILPVPSFALQYALKARGFVSGSMIDVIGGDGIGKTTTGNTLMGWNMSANGPCLYIEAEGKPQDRARVERALHKDRAIATQMYDAITREPAREIREAVNKIEEWIFQIRAPGSMIPPTTPAMVVLDTYSKLMSASEAAGYSVYDSVKDKEKDRAKEKKETFKKAMKGVTEEKKDDKKSKLDSSKELMAGSNFGHARAAQEWTRRLAYILSRYNVILVLLRHQNDTVDMGGGGGIPMSAEVKDSINRTSIGGRAFHQSAAYQFILSRMKNFKASIHGMPTNVGVDVKYNITKNNNGPLRQGVYRIMMEARQDTELTQEPAIDFDCNLAEVLMRDKLFNVRIKNVSTVVTSEFSESKIAEEYDIEEFKRLFYSRTDLIESLQRHLEFAHFDTNVIMPNFSPVNQEEPVAEDAVEEPALVPDA